MSTRVLVLYASTHGHTRKIAERFGSVLEGSGLRREVMDVREVAEEDLDRFGAVVVGASIHAGKHQPEIITWAHLHAEWLQGLPSAFFSVCLTAAEEDEEARGASLTYLSDFADATGWKPDESLAVAGALQYQEYDFFTRHLMKLMMKRGGHPTDASHDYEYTDWAALEDFARRFAERVGADPA